MNLDSVTELRAWLNLLGIPLDRHLLTGILQSIHDPEEALSLSDRALAEDFGFNEHQRTQWRRLPKSKEIDRQIEAMEQHSMELLPVHHPGFPQNLFRMRTPPPAVFVKGKLEPCDSLAVGIVGPRQATPYGLDVTRRLVQDLAPTLTIISGAAMGIDSRAHETALEAGGRTIAVLGCGIDVEYPSGNAALRKRIGSGESGALLSTFPPTSQPLRHHFPARNFVLAGLSLGVVIIEASMKSGALVTARAAGDEGRTVYAVPGDITRKNSTGSNALIRDGATLCTCADDILSDLEPVLQAELELVRERQREAGMPAEADREEPLTPGERRILADIEHHPISHDDLMARYVPDRMSVGDLSTALLMLELKNKIQQMPGRIYAPRL